MLNKTFFFTLLVLTAGLFTLAPKAEARSHSRTRAGINVNVGTGYHNTCVTRRYVHPVVIPTVVYAPQVTYTTYPPVYNYQAPVYVEEVYVAPAPRRAFGFGGLSFSWNFFK